MNIFLIFRTADFPSKYNFPNIISVGAIDSKANIIRSSNFGYSTVDIVAPGKYIYSTIPNNKYGFKTGTSMATPIVAGVVSQIMRVNKNLSVRDIYNLICSTTTHNEKLENRVKCHGYINMYKSIQVN